MQSASKEASQEICNGSRPSFSSLSFCMWGILNLLHPFTFIASFRTPWSVTKILFAFHGGYSKNAYKTLVQEMNQWMDNIVWMPIKHVSTIDQLTCWTAGTRSFIVLTSFLYWIAWTARKKPKSKILKSGELGGWQMSRQSLYPSCLVFHSCF